ncbi:MAG: alanine--tRNA ligase, partial [Candidatus ainarchaeum sp.]|nr:alanine--tRNA ligase [Candidatus ainarchaeum sp.]
MITSTELRKKYLSFFESKGHKIIASASLIPENDPSVLFTTAGMHPLVPFLLGEKHPQGNRLCDVQKCIRTGDIDEVGDNWHLSFFEMLGNWSLGDYFKKEAVEFSFEFLTKELNIPISRLSVTCFKGDNDAPREEIVDKVWEKLGIPKDQIHFLPKVDNWWETGNTGPGGPDSEMFYHVLDVKEKNTDDFIRLNKEGKFCEIWNDVFMQYNKSIDGKYTELKQKNIDTGMGLERTIAVLNGFTNAYEIDTMKPIYNKVLELTKKEKNKLTEKEIKSIRVITDHLRTATMILGDDKAITPSNVDQGYVLRKFIRRSIRHARLVGIEGKFCKEIAKVVVEIFKDVYPEVNKNKEFIFSELEKEEDKFSTALESGLAKLEKNLFFLEKSNKKELNAKSVFDLYQSFGFPIEMTKEICQEKGFTIDQDGFNELLKEHQEKSRIGAEQKFKGGLADNSLETTALHTATHLVHGAMMKLINENIIQKGSNITVERLRFDFNSDERLTDEQLKQLEDYVNKAIEEKCVVSEEIMSLEEAKKSGAHGIFDNKYGEKVKVYTIKSNNGIIYSKEICGGPHVKNTSELGHFKILKQEAVAQGVKRIKA